MRPRLPTLTPPRGLPAGRGHRGRVARGRRRSHPAEWPAGVDAAALHRDGRRRLRGRRGSRGGQRPRRRRGSRWQAPRRQGGTRLRERHCSARVVDDQDPHGHALPQAGGREGPHARDGCGRCLPCRNGAGMGLRMADRWSRADHDRRPAVHARRAGQHRGATRSGATCRRCSTPSPTCRPGRQTGPARCPLASAGGTSARREHPLSVAGPSSRRTPSTGRTRGRHCSSRSGRSRRRWRATQQAPGSGELRLGQCHGLGALRPADDG